MTERKFTDEQIIKALECCVNGTSEACLKCTFGLTPPYPVCKTMVEKYALDLINRQRAEIDDLQLKLSIAIDDIQNHTIEKIRESVIRFVAVKEFAERLKKFAYVPKPYGVGMVVDVSGIDRLVEEMTGGNNENT